MVFFDILAPCQILVLFAQDIDSYLYFEEQMAVFTVIIAMFYHLLEELNFDGLYDLIPPLKSLIESFIEITANFEKSLRVKVYKKQNASF